MLHNVRNDDEDFDEDLEAQGKLFEELDDVGTFMLKQEAGRNLEIKATLEIKDPKGNKLPIKIPICGGTLPAEYIEEAVQFFVNHETFTKRVRAVLGTDPSGRFRDAVTASLEARE